MTSASHPSVAVVMPAYQEGPAVAEAIARVADALDAQVPDWELLVVESGSTDDTLAQALAAAEGRPRVRVLRQERREGYGSAMRLGIAQASKAYISVVPVDVCFPLETYGRALPYLADHDAVLSFRSEDPRGWRRRLMSETFNGLMRHYLGARVRHVNSAFKILPRDLLLDLDLASDGWFLDGEIVAHLARRQVRVAEIPVPLIDRAQGATTVDLRGVLKVLAEMRTCRRRLRARYGR